MHHIDRLEARRLLAAEGPSPTVIDLLALYTPAASLAAGGDAQVRSLIRQALNTTNQALLNSLVPVTIRLVHAEEIAYAGSGDVFTDRVRLQAPGDGHLDAAHVLRDAWGADLVHLVTDGSPGGGGNAALLDDLARPDLDTLAFSAMDHTSLQPSNLTLAHELGHNLGAGHERGNPTQPAVGPFSYSYGHRFTGTDGVVYHDVMSYDPGLVVPYFANPAVSYAGTPTGAPIGSPDEADLHATFLATAPAVAAYRDAVVPDTLGPVGAVYELAPGEARTLVVTVRWRDDAAVDLATLDDRDLFVRTPEGFDLAAEFIGADASGDAFQVLARYRATLPDSDPPLDALSFHVRGDEVRDVANNAAPAGPIVAPADDTAAWDLQAARPLGAPLDRRTVFDSIDRADNDDVFRFALAETCVVSLRLSGMADEANVFLLRDANGNGVYDPGSEFIAGTFLPGGGGDRAVARTLGAGTYFAWVYAQQFEQVDTRYTLTFSAYADATAPTAALDATDVKDAGAPHADFAVTYRDDREVDAVTARFNAALDIDVQLDTGGSFSFFYFPDPDLNPQHPQNAREVTTLYRIFAFNSSTGWTVADNGTYTVRIRPGSGGDPRVSDAAGNQVPLLTLGSFRVAIGPPDAAAPTASAAPAPVLVPGATAHAFTVAYRDNVAVDVATLGAGDVRVTGPAGFSQPATFISVTPAPPAGSTRYATYRFTPPGGAWDYTDDGDYVIHVEAGQVFDTSGNAVPGGAVATLDVHVPLPGDANGDDRVNLADFNLLAAHFGRSGRGVASGDANFDGLVNLSDFNLLAGHFGQELAASAAVAPEPRRDALAELLA